MTIVGGGGPHPISPVAPRSLNKLIPALCARVTLGLLFPPGGVLQTLGAWEKPVPGGSVNVTSPRRGGALSCRPSSPVFSCLSWTGKKGAALSA